MTPFIIPEARNGAFIHIDKNALRAGDPAIRVYHPSGCKVAAEIVISGPSYFIEEPKDEALYPGGPNLFVYTRSPIVGFQPSSVVSPPSSFQEFEARLGLANERYCPTRRPGAGEQGARTFLPYR